MRISTEHAINAENDTNLGHDRRNNEGCVDLGDNLEIRVLFPAGADVGVLSGLAKECASRSSI